MVATLRERAHRVGDRVAPRVVDVQGRPVVDEPEPMVPDQEVRIPRRAVHVGHERVEPDHVGGHVRVRHEPGSRVEAERAGEEVEADVEPGAALQQLPDLGIRLSGRQRRVEVDQHDVGHQQAERPPDLARDQLGDERLRPVPGATELGHVQPVVVRLHDCGQRASLAQRRDVPGGGHETRHGAQSIAAPRGRPGPVSLARLRIARRPRSLARPRIVGRPDRRFSRRPCCP